MTTIVYRCDSREMAADTCLVETDDADNTIYIGAADKIVRLNDGSLLGMSGDAEGQHIANILNDDTIPDFDMALALGDVKSECSCLLVRPDGRMFYISTNGEGWAEYTHFRDRFAAVGTGKQLAYGALEMDATAAQAVAVACRRHAYTNPPIQVVTLDQQPAHAEPVKPAVVAGSRGA